MKNTLIETGVYDVRNKVIPTELINLVEKHEGLTYNNAIATAMMRELGYSEDEIVIDGEGTARNKIGWVVYHSREIIRERYYVHQKILTGIQQKLRQQEKSWTDTCETATRQYRFLCQRDEGRKDTI